jgi:hypothetical protein
MECDMVGCRREALRAAFWDAGGRMCRRSRVGGFWIGQCNGVEGWLKRPGMTQVGTGQKTRGRKLPMNHERGDGNMVE